MWISILNYASGLVEFHDISRCEYSAPTEEEIAENWLYDKGYELDEVAYMITDEAPELYNGNTQTIIDMPL